MSTDQNLFVSEWQLLSSKLGFAENRSEEVLAELSQAYNSPTRAHHGVKHITQLIRLAKRHADKLTEPDLFLLAAYFHDYIYDIEREKTKSNEVRSAEAAETALLELGLPKEKISKVKRYITATEKHQDNGDPEINLFLDCDMSVLAAPPAQYEIYSAGIRREYQQIYTEHEYNHGRTDFLTNMLQRQAIFLTPEYSAGDKRAKENMERELSKIRERAM